MHTKARVDEIVIVEDAMNEVMAKDVSEDVKVDVEVVVDKVVVEDVEDEQVGVCDANVNVLEDVEDDVQEADVEGDLDQAEDAVHNVPADGKGLFCDAAVGEVVEPPLGDVVANVDVAGKMPGRSKVLDVQDVNVDL